MPKVQLYMCAEELGMEDRFHPTGIHAHRKAGIPDIYDDREVAAVFAAMLQCGDVSILEPYIDPRRKCLVLEVLDDRRRYQVRKFKWVASPTSDPDFDFAEG